MSNTFKKFAYYSADSNLQEAAQRLAFSFGYDFIQNNKKPVDVTANYLVFDPNNKVLAYANSTLGFLEPVNVFDELIGLLHNPKSEIQTKQLRWNGWMFDSKGSLTVTTSYDRKTAVLNLEEVKQMLVVLQNVASEFGFTDLFPKPIEVEPAKQKVMFTYQSTKNSPTKVRTVVVDKFGPTALSGYDVDDGNTFKNFLFSKIVGQIRFVK